MTMLTNYPLLRYKDRQCTAVILQWLMGVVMQTVTQRAKNPLNLVKSL